MKEKDIIRLRPNYGNWLSNKKLISTGVWCSVVFGGLVTLFLLSAERWLIILLFLSFLFVLSVFLYRFLHHRELSFAGGGLMGKIHQYVLSHLNWDGKGKFLDVGCGSGALTILCAKEYPEASCVGIDNWDPQWEFNQGMCEENAFIEGVSNRCLFATDDASKIDYPDESFDAVVSNLVYFHVTNNPDKEALLKETLRVLKTGGHFSLLDHFCQESIYGDINIIINHLKEAGIAEIHFIPNVEKDIPIPGWMLLNGKLANLGILYGKK